MQHQVVAEEVHIHPVRLGPADRAAERAVVKDLGSGQVRDRQREV